MKRTQIFLILILFLSAIIRLWGLGKIPEGFHADEAAFGYNAYSLLKTGKDEYGTPFPTILNIFGIPIGAVYSYVTIPFIHLFGLNEFAIRLPTALAGIALMWVTYKLIKELTANNTLAIISSFVQAIAPTSIFLSRVQSDPLMANFFLHTGLLLYLLYLRSSKIILLAVSGLLFIIAIYTHQAVSVLLPVILSLTVLYKYKNLASKKRWISVLFGILIIISSIWLYSQLTTRVSQLSFFQSPEVTIPLTEGLNEDGISSLPVSVARAFHNKLWQHGRWIAEAVAKYWSLDFLFFESKQPLRESVSGTGYLYLIEFPLLLYGVYHGVRKYRKLSIFLLSWLTLGTLVVATALHESPNIHRFYYIFLPLYFFISMAIYTLIGKKISIPVVGNIRVAPLVLLAYGVSLLVYVHQLFIHQPLHVPYYRGFAYKEMVRSLQNIYHNYDKIVITKTNQSPYIYLLFFMRYDPTRYQQLGSPRDYDYTGFDNYIFVPLDCPNVKYRKTIELQYPNKRILYINRGGCAATTNSKLIQRIDWRNGAEAFQFVENVSTESAINTQLQ